MSQQRNSFKFSGDELRKINLMLPRGYKFVTRDELQKKELQKTVLPKKKASMQVYIPAPPKEVPPPSAVIEELRAASMPIKKEEPSNEPAIKFFPPPPPPVQVPVPPPAPVVPQLPPAVSEEVVKTSQKLLERIQSHPAYVSLYNIPKKHETDVSLREIEIKVASGGEKYRVSDLEGDLQRFCLTGYKNNERSSEAYRHTAELEHFLTQLVKIDRGADKKQGGYTSPMVGRPVGSLTKKKNPPVKGAYQPYT